MQATRLPATAALTGIVLALFSTAPIADGHDPVALREAAMKTVGQSTGTIGDMMKGEKPFDAAAANAAFAAMQEALVGWEDLYPEGTEGQSSNEFVASDAVFTDPEGFTAAVVAFREDIDAAVAANADSQAAIGPLFGAVAENCRSCHTDYRIKR